MADAGYEGVVKETFEAKPLRTVLMIDDEFPTFSDLARGETEQTKKRFAQKDRAVALYDAFQKRHMICDVENVANHVRTDRLRKSDLVILDYHLGPGHNESDRAIEILRDLSGSKHFNTVVVYTAEPDLNKVWLDIIAGISGGWTAATPRATARRWRACCRGSLGRWPGSWSCAHAGEDTAFAWAVGNLVPGRSD